MRIGTWNIQKGLDGHWAELEALAADVITVQECGSETAAQAADRSGWTCRWQSGTWHKGLAVLAHSPYTIVEREEMEPWAVSVIVDGPTRFIGSAEHSAPMSDPLAIVGPSRRNADP